MEGLSSSEACFHAEILTQSVWDATWAARLFKAPPGNSHEPLRLQIIVLRGGLALKASLLARGLHLNSPEPALVPTCAAGNHALLEGPLAQARLWPWKKLKTPDLSHFCP